MNYQQRIKKLQTYCKEHSLDAFLVMSRTNRQYLSGFTGSKGYLLVSPKSAVLYVDDRYTIRARKESPLAVRKIENLSRDIKKAKLKKIGIEDRVRLSQFEQLKNLVAGRRWIITSGAVEGLRAVKSVAELKHIKKGSRIIDQAFVQVQKLLRRRLKSGITEVEIAQEIEKVGKKAGAEALAFEPIVAFGPNAASPHHFSSTRKIGHNNFLLLDFGMKVKGYHTDFTRTLFIGKPARKQEEVYNIVLEAQQKAAAGTLSGSRTADVDALARDYIESAGYGDKYTHNGGHGVGLEIHELPNFSQQSEDVLQNNMVVTVEPGIYLEKKFGVRIEDMVVVGKRPQVLSKIPKDLKQMIIN